MSSKIMLIGSGWRAEYFLRVALLLPDRFSIGAVVTTNTERADKYARWGFKCFANTEDALTAYTPDYAIVCIAGGVAPDMVIKMLGQGVNVLDETPAAFSLEALCQMHDALKGGHAKFQMAEQYHLRPDHSARKHIIDTGLIGKPVQALISLTNTYHAVSLLRYYLGVSGANCTIRAQSFDVPGMPGHGRGGVPLSETPTAFAQTVATFDFGDGLIGLYDFEEAQHRSYIRTQRILIKGDRGCIDNDIVKYLLDYKTAMESRLLRRNRGEDENCEGTGLKGIIACGEWAYESPYPDVRLNDDEIAVAQCMDRMSAYLDGGASFYSFAQAAQDAYLCQLMGQAAKEGVPIAAQPQPWSKDLL